MQPLLMTATQASAAGKDRAGQVPTRSDIDARYKWDLSDYYANTAAWKDDLAATDGMVARLANLKGTLAQSATALLAVLELRDTLGVRLERVYAYAMLVKDQDTRESEPQALSDQASSLVVKYGEASSWFEPELLALPEEALEDWCVSEPKLAVYRHAFDDVLRQRRHVLSAREEELLAMGGKLAQAPREAFTMLTNADLKFPSIPDGQGHDVDLSEGRFSLYLQSPDRALRKRAFEGTLGAYLGFKNTIAATLAGSIQKDVFYARTHNYDNALSSALNPDNVAVAVYDNLIATVRRHLPKLHRYLDIRRRKLGLDRVHVYDTIVPLVDEEAPKIGYDDAVARITAGLEPLGPEYLEPMRKGFAGSWIDVYETQGKRSGAYSMGIYAVHPYILLNYNDTYNDMFTVAHEMGHAMHTWFTQHHQPPVYGDYPIFLAEVASTANEVILGDDLRQKATDRAERLFLLNLEVEKIRGTVINQTMWAEFEKLTHAAAEAGEPLTFETLAQTYRKLTVDYFGPAFAYDDEVDGYWLRIPHFYRGFYVYKYATSYCAATALATRVLDRTPGALDGYLGFLKAGSSAYPIEILKEAGVDLSTPQPIEDTMGLFGRLLDELEELLGN